MTNNQRLRVPPELLHLIEKRQLQDRREDQRRGDTDQRKCDVSSATTVDSVEDPESLVTEDRRSGEERRDVARRKTDE